MKIEKFKEYKKMRRVEMDWESSSCAYLSPSLVFTYHAAWGCLEAGCLFGFVIVLSYCSCAPTNPIWIYVSVFAYAFTDLHGSSWLLLYDFDVRRDKVCFCLCPPFSFNFLGQFTMGRNQLLSDSREVSQILFCHCR